MSGRVGSGGRREAKKGSGGRESERMERRNRGAGGGEGGWVGRGGGSQRRCAATVKYGIRLYSIIQFNGRVKRCNMGGWVGVGGLNAVAPRGACPSPLSARSIPRAATGAGAGVRAPPRWRAQPAVGSLVHASGGWAGASALTRACALTCACTPTCAGIARAHTHPHTRTRTRTRTRARARGGARTRRRGTAPRSGGTPAAGAPAPPPAGRPARRERASGCAHCAAPQ